MTNWAAYKSTLADLKAIPTATLRDGTPAILDKRWYFYFADETAVSDDFYVITPDTNTGRWLLDPGVGYLSQPNNWAESQRSQPEALTIDPLAPSLAINCLQSNYFLLTATQNFIITTPTNSESGRWFILSVMQPNTPFIITWNSTAFRYAGGVKPQLTQEPGIIDEILFRCRTGGASPIWLISVANNFREVL